MASSVTRRNAVLIRHDQADAVVRLRYTWRILRDSKSSLSLNDLGSRRRESLHSTVPIDQMAFGLNEPDLTLVHCAANGKNEPNL
jgi:hypothetical protein